MTRANLAGLLVLVTAATGVIGGAAAQTADEDLPRCETLTDTATGAVSSHVTAGGGAVSGGTTAGGGAVATSSATATGGGGATASTTVNGRTVASTSPGGGGGRREVRATATASRWRHWATVAAASSRTEGIAHAEDHHRCDGRARARGSGLCARQRRRGHRRHGHRAGDARRRRSAPAASPRAPTATPPKASPRRQRRRRRRRRRQPDDAEGEPERHACRQSRHGAGRRHVLPLDDEDEDQARRGLVDDPHHGTEPGGAPTRETTTSEAALPE